MKSSGPLSGPRTRARLASLAGVLVACALIGGSLVSLNRTVLPFTGWPSVQKNATADTIVPNVPRREQTVGRSGRASSTGAATVTLADGRVVALPLPTAIAPATGGATASTGTTPAAGPSAPATSGGTTTPGTTGGNANRPSTSVGSGPADGSPNAPVNGTTGTAPATPSVPAASTPVPTVPQTPVAATNSSSTDQTARDAAKAGVTADEQDQAPIQINLDPSAPATVGEVGDGLPAGVVVGVTLDPSTPVDTAPAVPDEAPPVDTPPAEQPPAETPPAEQPPAQSSDDNHGSDNNNSPTDNGQSARAARKSAPAQSAPAAQSTPAQQQSAPAPQSAPATQSAPAKRPVASTPAPAPQPAASTPAPAASTPAPAPAASTPGGDQQNGAVPTAGAGADDGQ